jgi:RIO kinase 1
VFKDRERYIAGERRFGRYSKGNSRKLIKLWSEKEVRNLQRLQKAGIPSPRPLFLRRNIHIMSLIGSGEPAPMLWNARIEGEDLGRVYLECVEIMRKMFVECGLVHADLSEYNLLYWKGKVHVIDVGQSVEWDHPNAKKFLEMDVANVTAYFRKKGVGVFEEREVYENIVSREGEIMMERDVEEMVPEESGSSESSGGDSGEGVGSGGEDGAESREEQKERRKKVKEERRVKREGKMSKKDKKKLRKKTAIEKRR